MIPLPRFNSILVAASRERIPDIKKEIEKLDLPTPAAGRATPFPLKKASAQNGREPDHAVLRAALSERAADAEPDPRHVRRQHEHGVRPGGPGRPGRDQGADRPARHDRVSARQRPADHQAQQRAGRRTGQHDHAGDHAGRRRAGHDGRRRASSRRRRQLPGGGDRAGRPSTGRRDDQDDFAAVLRPARTWAASIDAGVLEDVHITPDIRSNSLIVAAPPRTMDLISALINELDVPAAAQAGINIFTLKKADAVQTATLLQQLFTGTGDGPSGARPGRGRVRAGRRRRGRRRAAAGQSITLAGESGRGRDAHRPAHQRRRPHQQHHRRRQPQRPAT